MAQAPTHKLGEAIGKFLEEALISRIEPIAREQSLYLDYEHERPARNGKKKVSWWDANGNKHDFDLVVEAGGSEERQGEPRAFIEVAWRRYTKHSKNKAQEISGAVLRVIDRYSHLSPFAGAALAGEFTEPALRQMRSEGFTVLYLPREDVEKAFSLHGVDVSYNQSTSDATALLMANKMKALPRHEKQAIAETLFLSHREDVDEFTRKLRASLSRRTLLFKVLALYSNGSADFSRYEDACAYISNCPAAAGSVSLERFEVCIEFSNGTQARASHSEPEEAIRFIRLMGGIGR